MIPELIIRLNALLCHFDKTYIWVTLWQISVVRAFSIFFCLRCLVRAFSRVYSVMVPTLKTPICLCLPLRLQNYWKLGPCSALKKTVFDESALVPRLSRRRNLAFMFHQPKNHESHICKLQVWRHARSSSVRGRPGKSSSWKHPNRRKELASSTRRQLEEDNLPRMLAHITSGEDPEKLILLSFFRLLLFQRIAQGHYSPTVASRPLEKALTAVGTNTLSSAATKHRGFTVLSGV